MKAKIRKTDEIVDIICYNHCSTIRSHQDYVSYIDSKGIEHDREALNYYWDFEPIETANNDHWQDVRERAAIAAMQGLLANPQLFYDNGEEKRIIEAMAMSHVDELVKRLKKE